MGPHMYSRLPRALISRGNDPARPLCDRSLEKGRSDTAQISSKKILELCTLKCATVIREVIIPTSEIAKHLAPLEWLRHWKPG